MRAENALRRTVPANGAGERCRRTVRVAAAQGVVDCGLHREAATPQPSALRSLGEVDLVKSLEVAQATMDEAAATFVEVYDRRARHVPRGRTRTAVDQEFAALDTEVDRTEAALDAALAEVERLEGS